MDPKFYDEFSRLQGEINKFFNHLQNLTKTPVGFATTAWVPQINLYEEEDRYILLVELPGVEPKDLNLTVQGKTLIIQGEKKPTDTVATTKCQHMEITFGPFSRSIELPVAVNSEGIQANYKNGLLEITIPKQTPKSRYREIEIE
ncbi:MAG: Hsp20/alpha crystallin family protein [Calditrichaeota bacterium]|nr:MAG: Hsp20/alpha crystallin family protein [Calditrichota bacterium]